MIGVTRSSFCCTHCTPCFQAQRCLPSITKRTPISSRRSFSASSFRQDEKPNGSSQPSGGKEEGALSRRLAEMTEESLLEGGRSARKNLQEAGFSDDLKRALEEKIKAATFKSDNAQAFSVLNTPVSLGYMRDICIYRSINDLSSQAQEKALASMPWQHLGAGQKTSKILHFECSMTPNSLYEFLSRSRVL